MLPLRFRWLWLGGGLVQLGIILYLALRQGPAVDGLLISDKAAHIAAFLYLMTWFGGVFPPRRMRRVSLALLSYGILIEILQSRLSYRQAEVADIASDLCGILLGWIFLAIGLRHWTSKVESWIRRV